MKDKFKSIVHLTPLLISLTIAAEIIRKEIKMTELTIISTFMKEPGNDGKPTVQIGSACLTILKKKPKGLF